MPDNDVRDPLLEQWQRTYREGQEPGSPSCPETETLVAMALGRLEGDERTTTADHVVGCARCTPLYQNLLKLHAEARPELAGGDEPRTGNDRRPFWRVAAVAAVVIAGVGLSVLLWPERQPPVRTTERGPTVGAAAVMPADREVLTAPPSQLGWDAVDGADSYWVVLYDFESTPVWESARTSETEVELPAELRELLVVGRPYYWRVFSLIGVERHQSPLYQFELGP